MRRDRKGRRITLYPASPGGKCTSIAKSDTWRRSIIVRYGLIIVDDRRRSRTSSDETSPDTRDRPKCLARKPTDLWPRRMTGGGVVANGGIATDTSVPVTGNHGVLNSIGDRRWDTHRNGGSVPVQSRFSIRPITDNQSDVFF